VHVSVGAGQADGRSRLGRARANIALGTSTSLVDVGGVAIGLLSVGGVALGLVAVGAVAVGLAAVGAVPIGLLAVGAVAIGLTAVGVATAGVAATPRSAATRWHGDTCRVEDEGSAEVGRPIRSSRSRQTLAIAPHRGLGPPDRLAFCGSASGQIAGDHQVEVINFQPPRAKQCRPASRY
jgi:hypothetical protein